MLNGAPIESLVAVLFSLSLEIKNLQRPQLNHEWRSAIAEDPQAF